ncbi:hypothetical protein HYALB_00001318 [Hymenoscyphus albidus]|uniref:DnaJ-domain-containing protein n=1 Tax=Hymenoscyphus albidus TaxID=595503 RepID=A0A9N9PRW0_9HELO|nr:hypothetical protein HYALB_00001318 [Hymenoscyphus albidus]
MGAQQSSSGGGTGSQSRNSTPVKRCYYEVLGVDRHATDDEIKKAYRRKALELHPDRNYGDAENATIKFAEVQSANEVLSDPQERAWYDSHRDSILRGDTGGEDDHFEHNIRLTSAGDIIILISKFNSRVPFTDASDGFYGILRETFATLAVEERSACEWEGKEIRDYPDFGKASDSYEQSAKQFYRVWMGFSTAKTFSWKDVYRTSDAPDRATRRFIEKENQRFRNEAIREFEDAVRSLVAFVRKRDPRYIPNSQSEEDRQKILRDAVAAQAAQSRAANLAKFEEHVIPSWAQPKDSNEDVFTESESDESEVEHIECVVCNKVFKSEKQYETHEKSKKHVKAVQQIQREMKKENKRLGLDTLSSTQSNPVSDLEDLELDSGNDEGDTKASTVSADDVDDPDDKAEQVKAKGDPVESDDVPSEVVDGQGKADSPSGSSEVDDEYAPREAVEERLDGLTETSNSKKGKKKATSEGGTSTPKLGKAKEKRAKRAAKEALQAQEDLEFKCAACSDSFASKTKLFNHIKEYNHAQPVQKGKGKNKKK